MSNLLGNVSFKILLSEEEIRQISQGIGAFIDRSAEQIVERLADAGVRYLKGLNDRGGHPFLARTWTSKGPFTRPEGGAWAEIYSTAEDMTLPVPNSQYTIRGENLLKILEGGAKRHTIYARNAERLVFSGTPGWHKSLFRGTMRSSFLNGKRDLGGWYWNLKPRQLISVPWVSHPGVSPNRFVQWTKEFLEERLAAEAQAILARTTITRH